MSEFLHDAEYRTESWKRRHSPEAIAQLGVWRWKGIQSHSTQILDAICGKRVIDFGGADGPLGFGSIIVDAKAEAKTFDDVDGRIEGVFTSHALEHLDDPQAWLESAYARLDSGVCLIVHLPANTCRLWRAGQYANPNQPSGHRHTFCLSTDLGLPEGEWWDRIDSMVSMAGFDLELVEYCGDDSIILFARKPQLTATT